MEYGELAATIDTYADREVDFADTAFARPAERKGIRRMLTADRRDLGTCRLTGKAERASILSSGPSASRDSRRITQYVEYSYSIR